MRGPAGAKGANGIPVGQVDGRLFCTQEVCSWEMSILPMFYS